MRFAFSIYLAALLLPMKILVAGQAPVSLPITVPVWPGVPPGGISAEPESDLPAKGDGVIRTTNVSVPTLTIYRASASVSKPAPAVLICPGGGYNYLAINKEGSEIAEWLNTLGITGIVLKYRVPQNKAGALQDAQRALALIRSRAAEWEIDPGKLGIMGFSAGGHLAAVTAARAGQKAYPPRDEVDQQSAAVDFAILVYPAYLSDKTGILTADFQQLEKFPPTFFAITQDDRKFVPGVLALYGALSEANVPAELHVFAEGGHAWGLRHKELPVKEWPKLCAAWLARLPRPEAISVR